MKGAETAERKDAPGFEATEETPRQPNQLRHKWGDSAVTSGDHVFSMVNLNDIFKLNVLLTKIGVLVQSAGIHIVSVFVIGSAGDAGRIGTLNAGWTAQAMDNRDAACGRVFFAGLLLLHGEIASCDCL